MIAPVAQQWEGPSHTAWALPYCLLSFGAPLLRR